MNGGPAKSAATIPGMSETPHAHGGPPPARGTTRLPALVAIVIAVAALAVADRGVVPASAPRRGSSGEGVQRAGGGRREGCGVRGV